MEVKINSEELIKPSSPTPKHLRTFKLSLLDQLVQFPFTPVIAFYSSNSKSDPRLVDVSGKLDLLKKSLSRTLTQFYPLAGKIRDSLTIDCNDEGARFVVASVNMSLTQFLAVPDLVSLNKLLPSGCEFAVGEFPELTHPTNVQVTVFMCGGIALAMCNMHRLHDGTAEGMFLKEWVAVAQGGGGSASSMLAARDLMVAEELFPANDLWLNDVAKIMFISLCKTRNSVTERFVFTGPAIEALRAQGKGPSVPNPTRVEAVTGFLWKCAISAIERKNNGLKRPSVFTHLVNIRKRMNPPILGPIGNFLWTAAAHFKNDSSYRTDDIFASLVGELRGAISKVDGDFVSRIRQDKNLISSSLGKVTGVGLPREGVDTFFCSSWGKFGYYDADFGWGRPIWLSSVGLCKSMFLNLLFLVETRSGDGIEAWVTMGEQEMALLLENPELHAFAHFNPSPLIISSKI